MYSILYPPQNILHQIKRILPVLLLLVLFSKTQAQDRIKIQGYTTYTDKKGKKSAVSDMHINVYKGADKTDEYASNKKGKFEFYLDFGSAYRIVLEGNE